MLSQFFFFFNLSKSPIKVTQYNSSSSPECRRPRLGISLWNRLLCCLWGNTAHCWQADVLDSCSIHQVLWLYIYSMGKAVTFCISKAPISDSSHVSLPLVWLFSWALHVCSLEVLHDYPMVTGHRNELLFLLKLVLLLCLQPWGMTQPPLNSHDCLVSKCHYPIYLADEETKFEHHVDGKWKSWPASQILRLQRLCLFW